MVVNVTFKVPPPLSALNLPPFELTMVTSLIVRSPTLPLSSIPKSQRARVALQNSSAKPSKTRMLFSTLATRVSAETSTSHRLKKKLVGSRSKKRNARSSFSKAARATATISIASAQKKRVRASMSSQTVSQATSIRGTSCCTDFSSSFSIQA